VAAALAANPIITHIFTSDPAAMVYNGRVYLYTGHDEQAAGGEGFVMNDWHVFSSSDMVNWTDHGEVLKISAFTWARADAWAGQCIERNGRFYWYVPMSHRSINGFAIGVAVADSPTGPFRDARGSALITNDMTRELDITWDDIDPTVLIDDDGQAYLYWGNTHCRVAKLKSNMIELDGPIMDVPGLNGFTEGPYIHKKNGIYYMSFAAGFPETIDYATSNSPLGPWTYRGRINDLVANSPTNHQAIIEFNRLFSCG
jgi:beta-xylosidase